MLGPVQIIQLTNAKGNSTTDTASHKYPHDMAFLQANLGRGYAATKECLQDAESAGVGILLLQEPYIGSRGYVKIPHKVIQNKQGSEPVKSAVVILDPSLTTVVNPQHVTKNIASVTVSRGKLSICVISVYFEGDHPLEDYLTTLREVISSVNTPNVIIGGDINATSHWWGCSEENRRGSEFVELASEVGLNFLNRGCTSTYHTYRGGRLYASIVDITACSDSVLGRVFGWEVIKDDTGLSDHRRIRFRLSMRGANNNQRPATTRCYNTNKADWGVFNRVLANRLIEENLTVETVLAASNVDDLERLTADFTGLVKEACGAAIPPCTTAGIRKKMVWMTDELTAMKSKVKTLRRRISGAHPDRKQYVYAQYAQAREEYTLKIEKAVTESWKAFCCKQTKEDIWKSSYRVIKRCIETSTQQECLLKSPCDGTMLTPAQSAHLLAETFFPSDDVGLDDGHHKLVREEAATLRGVAKTSPEPSNFLAFTHEEVEIILSGMNPSKAPGEDGLTSDICRRVYSTSPVLLAIYNKCLKLSYFPRIWKKAWIKVIPKPGKEDYTAPKAYRPIGLLPILGKILEKLIFNRLSWGLFQTGRLSQRQYGFVPQKSTEDALHDTITFIQDGLKQKKLVAAISLDIEGAFDGAWWPAIVKEIGEKCTDEWITRIVYSYLEDRKVTLSYLGEKFTTNTERGCIQGSIGGPLLWNILLDPLLRRAESERSHVQAFADDILVLARADTTTDLNNQINSALEMIARWGEENKLRFAAHKTQAMLVTRKIKYETPAFKLSSTPLELSSEIRLLGLTIDRTLSFRSHLERVTTKAINIYKMVTRMAKAQWGLNSDIIRTIYFTVVEPIVLYAAGAWGDVAGKEFVRRRLDRVTRAFSIRISKAHRTISLVSGALLARILPLDLRLREQLELYKIKRGKEITEVPGRILQQRVRPSELLHPALRTRLEFGHIMSPEDVRDIPGNRTCYYTDGSKLEGRVGAAVTVWNGEEEIFYTSFRLENFCTVFQAEIVAIHRATELALKKKSSINILSDSRAALQSVCDPETLNPVATDIRANIQIAENVGIIIKLFWIKAHMGIPGNERADELAKQAALKNKKAPAYDRVPLSFAKRTTRQATLDKWQERYSHAETASVTKIFFSDIRKAKSTLEKMDTNNILTQMFTGHGGFRQYLHRFKLADSPFCVCDDQSEETVVHILAHCPRYGYDRLSCEHRMGFDLTEINLSKIVEDDTARTHFLAFAVRTLRKAAKANGSTIA